MVLSSRLMGTLATNPILQFSRVLKDTSMKCWLVVYLTQTFALKESSNLGIKAANPL